MRILIVSDTHGRNTNLEKVIRKVAPIDLLIHLGDLEGSEGDIENTAPCPVEMVSGNNDFYSMLDKERYIRLGKYKVMLTHGHYFSVGYDTTRIKQAALARACDIVMFGHTHRPLIETNDDVIAINPGSISYPRQENHKPSYIIMDIDRFGEAHFTINYL